MGPPGSPPRTFIAKLMNYRNRDNNLHLTGELGHLTTQNTNIPDFYINIQKESTKFIVAKKKLWELNIKYSMLYPSKFGAFLPFSRIGLPLGREAWS